MLYRIVLLIALSGQGLAAKHTEITVYTHDSFSSKDGLGPIVAAHVEKKHAIRTRFVPFGSAGEALNQIVLEGERTKADLIVGVDNGMLARARATARFTAAPADLLARVPADLRFDKNGQFIAYDYGFLAFVYDSRRTTATPANSLAEFKGDRIVVEDPRTSSIGLAFLTWTELAAPNFWKTLAPKLVGVSPSWTGAYGMFLKKQADYVLSYTTSPAYHLEKEGTDAFRAVVFADGHYRQIEGAALVKHSKQAAAAHRWLSALLSDEVQSALPLRQWMYPAVDVPLPESFRKLPKIVKAVDPDPEHVETSRREWIRRWATSPGMP